jgi:hypothetical protein
MSTASGLRERSPRRSNLITYFLQSGSPRVINCLRIFTELNLAERDEQPKFLFHTPILNKCVIFKDLYAVEGSLGMTKAIRVGTKLYIPFDMNRLGDGGHTFFYSRREFMTIMAEFIDLSDTKRRDALVADSQVLELLDRLPTFAPFLVRCSFERAQIEVDPLYLNIPETEWEEIRCFIRERFRQILSAVNGQKTAATTDALERLLDKLWDMNDVPTLEALALAFGLPAANCLERFDAWKGTLYFCWAFETLQKAIFEMGSWLLEWPHLALAYPPNMRSGAKVKFKALHDDVFQQLRGVEVILSEYERAFNDLFVHGAGPERFIKFLSEAPSRFSACGVGIGMLQHAHEVWDRLTETFPQRQASYQVLDEVIHAVNGVLARPL